MHLSCRNPDQRHFVARKMPQPGALINATSRGVLEITPSFTYCQKMPLLEIKLLTISLPASPTRLRSDYPSRTPARRRHGGFGAKNGVLTSPVPEWMSEDTPLGWSPSSECGRQMSEWSKRPFSGTCPLRKRAGNELALLWWIWSLVVPYFNLDAKCSLRIQGNKTCTSFPSGASLYSAAAHLSLIKRLP